jgi:DnaJ-domain-containing protein 1
MLIEATVADGVVAPEERAYLRAVACEIGLSDAELDRKVAAQIAR